MGTLGVYENYIKRVTDIVLAACGLMVLAPILAVIALKIKLEDGGSIIYRGLRIGKNGEPFRIYKFRTMVMNAEQVGGPSTSEDDPRVTKVGKVLRKYKLDEPPQLVNVLKGEMSIVGPRPEVPMEVETYTEEERRVLTVKPGITDWASITFRNEGEILKGSVDPHQAYREKIRPDKLRLALAYVDNVSFRTDALIIMKTIKAVLAV
jgi:lipopolysaccharide/colanic/teichoic acid biosynthesis glycosyltransferase